MPNFLPSRSAQELMPASLRPRAKKTGNTFVGGCSLRMETRSSPCATAFRSESGTPPPMWTAPPTTSAVTAPPPVARSICRSMPNSRSQPFALARSNHMLPTLGGVGRPTFTVVSSFSTIASVVAVGGTAVGAVVAAGALVGTGVGSSPPQATATSATTTIRAIAVASRCSTFVFFIMTSFNSPYLASFSGMPPLRKSPRPIAAARCCLV